MLGHKGATWRWYFGNDMIKVGICIDFQLNSALRFYCTSLDLIWIEEGKVRLDLRNIIVKFILSYFYKENCFSSDTMSGSFEGSSDKIIPSSDNVRCQTAIIRPALVCTEYCTPFFLLIIRPEANFIPNKQIGFKIIFIFYVCYRWGHAKKIVCLA